MSPLLIIGKNGQLASALARSLRARGQDFKVVSGPEVKAAVLENRISELIHGQRVSGVINAVAYTNVDAAESDLEDAEALNHMAPGMMARACADQELPFVHISTDYVFSGAAKTPYKTDAKPRPVNVYGQSKARGEQAVMDGGAACAVLRTSWLYDGRRKNFLTTMLRLAKDHGEVSVVNDQIGRPTYAGHLAEACLSVIANIPSVPAIYHVTNSGDPVTWAGFAREIFRQSGMDCPVTDIRSFQRPSPAPRPAYSVLDICKFEHDFHHSLLPWQEGLTQALKENI